TKSYRSLLVRSRKCLAQNRPACRKETGLTNPTRWIPRLYLQFEIGGRARLRPRFGFSLIQTLLVNLQNRLPTGSRRIIDYRGRHATVPCEARLRRAFCFGAGPAARCSAALYTFYHRSRRASTFRSAELRRRPFACLLRCLNCRPCVV